MCSRCAQRQLLRDEKPRLHAGGCICPAGDTGCGARCFPARSSASTSCLLLLLPLLVWEGREKDTAWQAALEGIYDVGRGVHSERVDLKIIRTGDSARWRIGCLTISGLGTWKKARWSTRSWPRRSWHSDGPRTEENWTCDALSRLRDGSTSPYWFGKVSRSEP